MSETQEPADDPGDPTQGQVHETVEKILSEGERVRDRIREMVTGSVKDQEFSAANLGNTARKIVVDFKGVANAAVSTLP